MTYKCYFVVIVIMIVVLYFASKWTETEQFDPNLRISDENIKLISESFANKFAAATFANVISPCWRDNKIKDIDQMIECVVSYDEYYERVLGDIMFDMYHYIKSVEDTYIGFDYVIDTREEEAYTLIVAHSYKVALSVTLDYIKNYRPYDGFDELVFLPIFRNYLTQMLNRAIALLYVWNPLDIPQ